MNHLEKEKRKQNPREKANIFSLLTFAYAGELFRKGCKNDLEDEDLYEVIRSCSSKRCGDKLEKGWIIETKNEDSPSIYRLLWKQFGWRYIRTGLIDLVWRVFNSVVEPYALTSLISYFNQGPKVMPVQDAYFYAAVVITLNICSLFFKHNYDVFVQNLAIEIKTAFSSLLYRKALRLTPSAVSNISVGKIVNLITKDVDVFKESIWMIIDSFNGIVQSTIICCLLYSNIGPIALVGISILLAAMPIQDQLVNIVTVCLYVGFCIVFEVFSALFILFVGRISIMVVTLKFYRPVNNDLICLKFNCGDDISFLGYLGSYFTQRLVIIGKYVSKLRLKSGAKTDERLQVTQETLSTIRIIKMYTWEKFFSEKIGDSRKKEINAMLLGFFLNIAIIIIGVIFTKLGFYTLIMTYVWMNDSAKTEMIFYILAIFKDLEYNIGVLVPYGMGKAAEFYSAVVRIDKVIRAEELKPTNNEYNSAKKAFVELKSASVYINKHRILEDISLLIQPGLTLVTGTVGSGKSALLKAILQDYPLQSGTLNTSGRISYASQDPWLFPSSIRQNILFGETYNENKYMEVVRVCALEYDFSLLDKGDQTIVADSGFNLSKGQRARVNLARAIYRDGDIYLLDDSLTALDGHVQNYIFEECIMKYLSDKVCILVTQTASHIQQADNVVIMDRSRVKSYGPPDEDILAEVSQLIPQDDDLEKEVIDDEESRVDVEDDIKTNLLEAEQGMPTKKVYYEQKQKGGVRWSTYLKYARYGGGIIIALIYLVASTAHQGSESYSDQLLTQWVDEKQQVLVLRSNLTSGANSTDELEKAVLKEGITIKICSIMMLVGTAISLLRIYIMFELCRRASINLHNAVIHRIMKALMSFFDTHFVGNVLNRFSQDLKNVDETLPFIFMEFFRVIFAITGTLSIISLVNLKFLLYFAICISLMIFIRKIYQPTGRSLKRLEASTRSPMIGHLNASLEGVTTIRAYRAQHILIDEFDKHQDLYTSANYTSFCMSRAFGFMLDSLCSIYIIAILSTFLFLDKDASAGQVGLVLTQIIALADEVQWGVRQMSEIENNMTSVERLCEYTEIKEETIGGLEIEHWPTEGAISYEDVSLSYNNVEKVLKNLNFSVNPKESIGIVGRTGAGKSSIISTLFRLYDVEGRIVIDGVDIKTLSLKYLRRHIAIIPQDPVLFSGTIRTNLDPFGEYTEGELWNVLDKVNLKQLILNLDMSVSSHAAWFSSGQKQLICLARAILRKTKIVILDEATANLDPETDALLQKTVRENFSDCTILMIAHRLHSILKCDKVIVMDKGQIKEFETTSALLENSNGIFYNMVKQAGLINYLD